jgi:glycosyltransferase involved in cell wall biosynthesis
MKIFLEDSRFEIAVISRYDYSAHGINCYKLNDYRDNKIYDGKFFLKRGFLYLSQLIRHFIFIRNTLKSFLPDVIFLQTLLYPAFLLFNLRNKIPLIVTFWNGDVTWWAKWDFVEKIFKYNIVKKGIKSADIITVNSIFAKECCKKYYKNDDKIHVLPYPGVDLSIFYKRLNKQLLREKYNLNNEFIFFCPRGLADYLNNAQILSAFSILKKSIKFNIVYLIANSSVKELEHFTLMVEKYKLNNYIKLLSHLEQNEMAEMYSISDCTISISSNDSQPNCMLESLACETIVIMGDIPQIREWIIDEVTGFLCEINDVQALINKINLVIKDSTLLNPIKNNGLNLIKQRADLDKSKELIKNLVLNV